MILDVCIEGRNSIITILYIAIPNLIQQFEHIKCKIFTRCLHFLDKNTLSISQLELNRQFLYEVLPNYSNL